MIPKLIKIMSCMSQRQTAHTHEPGYVGWWNDLRPASLSWMSWIPRTRGGKKKSYITVWRELTDGVGTWSSSIWTLPHNRGPRTNTSRWLTVRLTLRNNDKQGLDTKMNERTCGCLMYTMYKTRCKLIYRGEPKHGDHSSKEKGTNGIEAVSYTHLTLPTKA